MGHFFRFPPPRFFRSPLGGEVGLVPPGRLVPPGLPPSVPRRVGLAGVAGLAGFGGLVGFGGIGFAGLAGACLAGVAGRWVR